MNKQSLEADLKAIEHQFNAHIEYKNSLLEQIKNLDIELNKLVGRHEYANELISKLDKPKESKRGK